MATHTQPTEKLSLDAEVRVKLGKHTRRLRKDGIIPGNIYGKDFTPVAIKLNQRTFNTLFKEAGETTVVYVNVEGKAIPTLISDIQYHPIQGDILHVDFRKVNLKQKIEAQVPLVLIGESEAVEQKGGVLLTQIQEITVSALPTDIPHEIEVDISSLMEIGDAIHVSDLPKSDTYEIQDEPERMVVSVTEHKEEELEPETTSAAPEITTEEGAEGEAGEAAPEEPEKAEK